MKALVPLALFAALVTAPAAARAAAPDSKPRPTIRQFLQIRTPNAPAVLDDGSLLMRDWPDGVWQLYRATSKSPGAPDAYRPENLSLTKLTSFPDGLGAFSLSPDERRVVLMHGRGGDENTQLTLLDLDAGPGAALEPILANPAVQARVNAWLRDGSAMFYSANDVSPNDFYLYRWDFASKRATRLVAEKGSWSVSDANRDGSRVMIQKYNSASDTECYELDAATGKRRDITLRPAGGTAACDIVGYMPDEKSVLMTSDYKGGRSKLYLLDLASGAVREPLPALGAHELDGAGVSDTRAMLVAVSNEDGYGVTHVYSLPDFRPLPAPTSEKGVVMPAGVRGRSLTWTINNARKPGPAFLTTYPEKGGAAAPPARQLTWTDDQGVDLGAFPLPQLVSYKSFDGRVIPAFLFTPPGYAKGKPIPFVVNYHGGPEGQSRPVFSAANQYLLSRGYGILMPNPRGSTGYGREFQMLDNYRRRWDSVRDGVDAAEWLVKSGYAAAGRIATMGGSYGGFMSVACIVEDQDRVDRGVRKQRLFGACVDVVGIVNMKSFLEKTSGYRRELREAEYGPLADTTFLATVSSIRRVNQIQVPVFIGHGFNDPRVPVEEAMQLAVALKDRGRRPRLFIAPDEGHGFQKLDNRVYFYERVAAFLDETIGAAAGDGAKPGTPPPGANMAP